MTNDGNASAIPTPVTVLGLGMMGTALATALLRAGHPTTVWNRTASKTEALAADGAKPAASVTDAVAASPVVIVCVLDTRAVRTLLDEAGDAIAGRTLVNLTTSTPEQARQVADRVTTRGAAYLDGGIMATPDMIGGPEANVLYSGSAETLDGIRTVLEPFGGITHVGDDAGLASLYDLALLSGMYGMTGGWFQALALVRQAGISAVEFAGLLGPWLDAMATYLPEVARLVDEQDREPDVAPMVTHSSALANIAAASRDQGVRPDLLAPLQSLFEQAADTRAVNLGQVVELLALSPPGTG